MVLFYSFTKRFTSFSHLVLGFSLGIAPAAAWIAMRGSLDPRILWLTAAVTFWTAGFDIIYSCQDYEFDVHAGLFSLPRRFGIAGALWIARAAPRRDARVSAGCWSVSFGLGALRWRASRPSPACCCTSTAWCKPNDLSRVDAAFFTMNGYVSVLFFLFWAADIISSA